MTTLFSDEAGRFATQPEDAFRHEANAACRDAIKLFREGRPGRARYELARAAQRCARIAGEGTPHVEPTCPCGGQRCPGRHKAVV